MRMGTRDLRSYFQGALAGVRVWNRRLSATEVSNLYGLDVAHAMGWCDTCLAKLRHDCHDTAGSHDATLVGGNLVEHAAATPAIASDDDWDLPAGSGFRWAVRDPLRRQSRRAIRGWNISQRYAGPRSTT